MNRFYLIETRLNAVLVCKNKIHCVWLGKASITEMPFIKGLKKTAQKLKEKLGNGCTRKNSRHSYNQESWLADRIKLSQEIWH